KYDLLVIDALEKIANCCKLVCERHDLDKICALPDGGHWSDVDKWLNDPKCLETANHGDLKMVFQFDSPGIRNLARKGGVTSFNDIVAYTSLFRPGPMECLRKGTKIATDCGYKAIEELEQ